MNYRFPHLIENAIANFSLSLRGCKVLTEAATGNYSVTPVIAALAGAEVYAFTKDTQYGSVKEVIEQTESLITVINKKIKIKIVTSLDDIPLNELSIVTNTGMLRPIEKSFINRLNKNCVIPLMWETWEIRESEIDLEACLEHGVKVYGTNEDDIRLRTKDYLGFILLEKLLLYKCTPYSSKVLLLGCDDFIIPVSTILGNVGYDCILINSYDNVPNVAGTDVIIILEHRNKIKIIGDNDAFIFYKQLNKTKVVIHLCGNVDFSHVSCMKFPDNPAPFGYMSLTADYIDPKAVIDLHTAGLKVAEGMLEANRLGLKSNIYKIFMENNYPAQAILDERFW